MLVGRCVPNNNWSSALIGRCALISRPDSTVGGKLTNHSYLSTCRIFSRDAARVSIVLAAIFASLRISIILLRCFHLRTFKTSVHIISDAKTASSCIQYCVWWENANFNANKRNGPSSSCFHFSIEGTCQLLVRFDLS